MLNRPTFGGHIRFSHLLYFLSGHDDSDDRVSLAWFVGTSSDFIPPTTSSRAPPVHEATGGHAIQTYPTATSEHTVAFCYNLSDIVSNSYRSKFCLYKLIATISDNLKLHPSE